tara:strand:- start:11195 stop:11956 length:762 start_codon:yes stop_codon:yes gene_type:complete
MIDDVTVFGDVHGCFKTLEALIAKIPDEHKKRLCFAGDLIDRGPRSRQVVEYVIKHGHDCVAGNHELMMHDWTGRFNDMLWLGNGGDACLDSYKGPSDPLTPYLKGEVDRVTFQDHQKWMGELPILIEYPNVKTPDGRRLVVSHSICHNQWKHLRGDDERKAKEAEAAVPWNRSFHNLKDAGFYNVIGHTPDEDNPKIKKIYANIDTGAFCGYGGWKRFKRGGLGYLTALHVPTMTLYRQECIDDDEDVQHFD